jgi:hypothetical protein
VKDDVTIPNLPPPPHFQSSNFICVVLHVIFPHVPTMYVFMYFLSLPSKLHAPLSHPPRVIKLIIFGEDNKLWSISLCRPPYPALIAARLSTNANFDYTWRLKVHNKDLSGRAVVNLQTSNGDIRLSASSRVNWPSLRNVYFLNEPWCGWSTQNISVNLFAMKDLNQRCPKFLTANHSETNDLGQESSQHNTNLLKPSGNFTYHQV